MGEVKGRVYRRVDVDRLLSGDNCTIYVPAYPFPLECPFSPFFKSEFVVRYPN